MISIVSMGQEQVDAVALISAGCFSTPWSADAFKSELLNPNSRTLVAMDGGNVQGFINAHFILDEVYINNIAVMEKSRNNGVGTALLQALMQKAVDDKSSFITLEVRISNVKAIKFYQIFGFIPQGVRKNFYQNPTENAVIYTKNLQ